MLRVSGIGLRRETHGAEIARNENNIFCSRSAGRGMVQPESDQQGWAINAY